MENFTVLTLKGSFAIAITFTGRRICLGDKLARMELYIFLSHLLHQFTFEPTEPTDDRESLDPGISVEPKCSTLVRAIQRE